MVEATFNLSQGDRLYILVGQEGEKACDSVSIVKCFEKRKRKKNIRQLIGLLSISEKKWKKSEKKNNLSNTNIRTKFNSFVIVDSIAYAKDFWERSWVHVS